MRLLKKRIIDPKKLYGTSTWQRLSAHFKTADSEEHYTGNRYKWLKTSDLLCSSYDFMMVDARNDGYIKDEHGVMYPIQSIVSIVWQVDCEKTIIARHGEYVLWLSNDEMDKMEEI